MIIISDCLTQKIDEGCLKVANSLARRIKEADPGSVLVSYGKKTDSSDIHLDLNRFFINRSLKKVIKDKNETVLYIPFASNTLGSAVRLYVMSKMTKKLKVVFCLRYQMDRRTTGLLRRSGAEILALSKESYDYYLEKIGNARYIKTGVDTAKFCPASAEKKAELRKKYGISPDKKVILHVGHLKEGRNVEKMLNIPDEYQVVLVVSSVTEKNPGLQSKLEEKGNIMIIDRYIENIQEVYQMSDIYFFPVTEVENCIDVPLSVLEAASCNIPIVTTPYGEVKELIGNDGFYELKSFESDDLRKLFDTVLSGKFEDIRKTAIEYDWNRSVREII
jgi:glycosyltransferase involved in cell wall biosynthesis